MRHLPVIVMASLLAVACSRSGPAESAATSAEPQASASQSEMAPQSVLLPETFLGKWDGKGRCTGISDMVMTITQETVDFYESTARIKGVTMNGPNDVTIQGDFSGEGQTWSAPMRLTLSDDGNTLTVQQDKLSTTRVRCPNP